MAIHFKETDKTFGAIQSMLEREENIAAQIKDYNTSDANIILKLRDELKRSWEDFSGEERKLNIAVVGRVKAGKSTFLNTLIFGGKHVLPEAFTPKTATLTKIEYAKENSLDVEFYSVDDWRAVEEQAKSSGSDEATGAAKELVQSVRNSGVDTAETLSKGHDVEKFTSDDELAGRLNRYVGEDGELTPLVKCVTLKINKPELEGISIVDTPGLNDPVISRTQRTRDFLALCDVVFFLSPATQFLDNNDVNLLKAQLPQKGVARLVLICSRFDDGLANAIYDNDSLQETFSSTKAKLKKQAVKIFSAQIKNYERVGNNEFAKILAECQSPFFVSSVLHNMIGKNPADYNEIEDNVFNNLNYRGDLDSNIIATIGDISPVDNRLQEIITQKDLTLARKAKNFVPLAEKNLRSCLDDLQTATQHKYNQLANNDKAELERQQKAVAHRINTIQSQLEEYFGDIYATIERMKIDILQDLRQSSRDYSTLETKTGYDTKVISFRVSDSKWYNPFTWGNSHKEYHSYQTRYTYVDTNDALENVRNYANDAASAIENGFSRGTEISNLKRKLLTLILKNFDSADTSFDPAYFRLLTERTLNKIDLPVIKLNTDSYLNSISSRFSGELRDSYAHSQIRSLLADIISKLFDAISETFTAEIVKYKQAMDLIKDNFAEHLLTDINKEFEEIKAACADKDKNVKILQNYIDTLEKLSNA